MNNKKFIQVVGFIVIITFVYRFSPLAAVMGASIAAIWEFLDPSGKLFND